MKSRLFFVLGVSFSISTQAAVLDIYEASVFFNSTSLGAQSLLHDGDSGIFDDFFGSGIDLTYASVLDADSLGTMTWSFTNNTGSTLEDAWLGGFFDAEIDPADNTFFNEFGTVIDVSGTGSGDNAADSYEIDEPGWLFGNIYDNLNAGFLDNTNTLTAASPDDVSMGLGFELGDLLDGATWTALFEVSTANIGGLAQTDPDSLLDPTTFYWNGIVDVTQPSSDVPEPSSLGILSFGLVGLWLVRRKKLS